VDLEYRNPAEDELRATLDAANVAFANELRDDDFELQRHELPVDRVIGAYDDGRAVGLTASIAFEMTVPDGVFVPTAGITYVGVMPTHRRRGILTELMRRQLDDLHERDEPLAVLWASEPVIYGRFGYGIGAPAASLEAERAGFAFRDDPGPEGSARLVSAEQARELFPPVFERARLQRVGMLSRSDARWDGRVQDPEHWRDGASPKYFVLIELDGRPEAFAMYRVKEKWERGMPQGEVRLVDAIATSPRAARELWRYLFGIDLVARVSLWNFDPASPLYLMVQDARRLQLRLGDGLWMRLVDVAEALRRRSYAGEGRVVLEVEDAFCPWNTGRYAAGAEAGATEDEPELRLSAADLASAYLGAFSFERLREAGRVEELADGAVARASALFRTPLPPYCAEPF
jgi:predicted acetyltransferase